MGKRNDPTKLSYDPQNLEKYHSYFEDQEIEDKENDPHSTNLNRLSHSIGENELNNSLNQKRKLNLLPNDSNKQFENLMENSDSKLSPNNDYHFKYIYSLQQNRYNPN